MPIAIVLRKSTADPLSKFRNTPARTAENDSPGRRPALMEAPLTHEIAVAAHQLPWSHKDPADRFLAATAQLLRLTLVTATVALLGLGDISTLANR
jgi:PIN domain nuclease of toxin-antitoxin system